MSLTTKYHKTIQPNPFNCSGHSHRGLAKVHGWPYKGDQKWSSLQVLRVSTWHHRYSILRVCGIEYLWCHRCSPPWNKGRVTYRHGPILISQTRSVNRIKWSGWRWETRRVTVTVTVTVLTSYFAGSTLLLSLDGRQLTWLHAHLPMTHLHVRAWGMGMHTTMMGWWDTILWLHISNKLRTPFK